MATGDSDDDNDDDDSDDDDDGDDTYVNALKSKCVFGGRPGSSTITRNTTRKFRTK